MRASYVLHTRFLTGLRTSAVAWRRLRPPTRRVSSDASTQVRDVRENTSRVQLRPYQEECIQSVLGYLAKGERRLGISLATGAGKTVIFSHLIDRVQAPTPNASQTLVLAHREELVEQAARHCRSLYPDQTVEIEMGTSHGSGLADITVASVASIKSRERLLRYDPSRFKLLLVDEAHHIVARTYLEVLRHFSLSEKDKSSRGATALVGVSATLSRSDGLSLNAAIDHIVYHKDLVDMIKDGWLAPVRFTTVQSGADLSEIRRTGGDFPTAALSKAVNHAQTNDLTVRSWLEIAGQRKSTLVFCVDLAHVSALTAAFLSKGIDARFVKGDTRGEPRAERLASFKSGQFPVLLNCGIYTEGTDIPNIDCIILARPTKSSNLLSQMVGRGLRNSPGKTDCHIIDMVANLEKGIVTTPTLFGLDPQEVVNNLDAESMEALKQRRDSDQKREAAAADAITTRSGDASAYNGKVTFTHFDDLDSLIADTSGEHHIRTLSSLAWVEVDHNRFVLTNRSGSFLTIEFVEHEFRVTSTMKVPKKTEMKTDKRRAPFMRPSTIAATSTFKHAVHAADTFAKSKFVPAYIFTRAAWRRAPASAEQILFLNQFRAEGRKLEPGAITKGQAADWITKLKHGAKGRLNRQRGRRGGVGAVEG